jgi:hypothetical protein
VIIGAAGSPIRKQKILGRPILTEIDRAFERIVEEIGVVAQLDDRAR